MMKSLRTTTLALTVLFAGMILSSQAEALMVKHQCSFCHSLHGGTSAVVPLNSPTNIEVLCMGCHLTANGATDAVQPHRSDGNKAEFHVTCTDCHEVHDNMQNWRLGTNEKMIGREDPEGDTPYAIIITREKDFNKNGLPDRGTVTQTCNTTVMNDCYTSGRRYVNFEQAVPTTTLYAWADNDEDGLDPIAIDPTDAIAIQSNQSDSGAQTTVGKNWSAYDSLCQSCHTQTSKHNLLTGASLTHQNSQACTQCHKHDQCFDRAGCSTSWSMPNRDLQVDTVSVAPATVNGGDTVTITVDVTNLGDDPEDIQIRYRSDIDGSLGFSTVTGVASGASAQTSFDWVTTTSGLHTITADIIPVIGELVTGNNSGTDSVTVN